LYQYCAKNLYTALISISKRLPCYVERLPIAPYYLTKKPVNLRNIVSNAVEASLQSRPNGDGQVAIGWQIDSEKLQVWVDDDGPGLDEARDVFVPFYTTKPHGSGIGLAMSRQIAEAHGGYLTLENHPDKQGCRACLWLPIK